jgi:hypothetical protein
MAREGVMVFHASSAATPWRRLALAAVALLVLSGCDGTDAVDQPQRATETDGATDLADDSPFEVEATVTPRPGMLDVEPVQIWYEHGSVDARTLSVTFASQGPPCEVLDRVEVDETDTRITVTLYHGRDPEHGPDEPCDGPPDRVFDVEVPLSRDYDFEEDVLVVGGSRSFGVEVEAMVTPRPGMLDVEPVRWWYDFQQGWDWGRGADDHTMLVTFASQGPPCQVLDRVEVDETETRVIITLFQGRETDIDPDEPCDSRTHVVGVDVPLSRDYGQTPYSLAGIVAETGEGAVVNGGHLSGAP